MVAAPSLGETLRVATYQTELPAKGPGLLLRDILKKTPAIQSRLDQIIAVNPDVLVLQGLDYDLRGKALSAFNSALGEKAYPFSFAKAPNSGVPTGLDMDGNGVLGEARDAMGYGRFAGYSGMAILSRYPIEHDKVTDFSDLLWKDVPNALLPKDAQGDPFPSPQVQAIQRLSSTAHWVVPIAVEERLLSILTFHATPPLFDGPEDQNGRRNADEIHLWQHVLDGRFDAKVERPFVIAGLANLDPVRGDGRREVIRDLLNDPRLSDPLVGQPTAVFESAGALRLSYVLPSSEIKVTGAAVTQPLSEPSDKASHSRHRLVWIDLELGGADESF